jgi:hypothetical protein
MFMGYYNDLQESISNTWRITPEVVAQYRDITNFKVTRHTVWIQARRDTKREWIQLRYCIKEEDVDMDIKDWQDDWRVSFFTQEIPTNKEDDAGQDQTHARDKFVPNKPNPSQKPAQQNKGGVPKKVTQFGKMDTTQEPKEQEKGANTAQGTTSSATQQEQVQTKRSIIHIGVA